jgi:hypothetical protein
MWKREHLQDLDVDSSIILKLGFKKRYRRGVDWIRTDGGLLLMR